jgi:hypothetical protein
MDDAPSSTSDPESEVPESGALVLSVSDEALSAHYSARTLHPRYRLAISWGSALWFALGDEVLRIETRSGESATFGRYLEEDVAEAYVRRTLGAPAQRDEAGEPMRRGAGARLERVASELQQLVDRL